MSLVTARRSPSPSRGEQSLVVLVHTQHDGSWREIAHGVEAAGHVVRTVRTDSDAVAEVAERWIDVVVTASDGEVPEFLRWLAGYRPSLPCVLFAGHGAEALRPVSQAMKSLVVVPGGPEINNLLTEVARLGPRRGFYTQAVELELFDYLQLVANNGGDRLVEVKTPAGPATFWFERGAMIHAQHGEREGEEAFFSVVGVQCGTFREALYTPPPKQTILRSSTHLLMEASRLLDEGALPQCESFAPSTGSAGEWASWTVSSAQDKTKSAVRLQVVVDDVDRVSVDDWRSGVDNNKAPAFAATSARAPNSAVRSGGNHSSNRQGIYERDDGPRETGMTHEGPLMNSLIYEDDEVRRVLVQQFFEEQGVVGVAILDARGEPLISELGPHQAYQSRAHNLVRAAARLSGGLGARRCESMVVRSRTQSHLVLASMGQAWVTLVVEPMSDPDEVRDRVMGIGP